MSVEIERPIVVLNVDATTDNIFNEYKGLHDQLNKYKSKVASLWNSIGYSFQKAIDIFFDADDPKDKRKIRVVKTIGYWIFGVLIFIIALPLLSGLFKATISDWLNILFVGLCLAVTTSLNRKLLS